MPWQHSRQVKTTLPSNLLNSRYDRPVEQVYWLDTVEFCERLSNTGLNYRLPVRAEWVMPAARGTTTPYSGRTAEKPPWPVINIKERYRGRTIPCKWFETP
jgi:formylglycine-generating enzyme required for sulfatase activity